MPINKDDARYLSGYVDGTYGPADLYDKPFITYKDLRSQGYAAGHYVKRCNTCGIHFEGDKRATTCLDCAKLAVLSKGKHQAQAHQAEKSDTHAAENLFSNTYIPPSGLGPTGDTGQYGIEDDGFITANMAADHAEIQHRKEASEHMTADEAIARAIENCPPPFLNCIVAEGRIKQRLIADIYNEIRVGLDITDKNSRNKAYDVARKIVDLVEDRDD